jgi:hypothetical protein
MDTMKDTLTAPLFELAHVKRDDLRDLVPPASSRPLKRIASVCLGLFAGVAATMVWRRIRR